MPTRITELVQVSYKLLQGLNNVLIFRRDYRGNVVWDSKNFCDQKLRPNNQLNVCNTSVTEDEVAGVKLVKAPPPPYSLLTVPMRGSDVVSVSCFGVRVSVMFHFMFVHYTFSSVWVAEWPPFGK